MTEGTGYESLWRTLTRPRTAAAVAVLIALFWITDALAHTLIGDGGEFTATLLSPSPYEYFHRMLGLAFALLLAVYITALRLRQSRATIAARTATARLYSVFDNSPDAVLGVDSGGTITYANPSGTRLLGIPADELVGVSCSDVKGRVAFCEGDCAFNVLQQTAEPVTRVHEHVGQDGSRWTEERWYPLHDSSGALESAIATIRDVTDQELGRTRLAEQRDWLEAAVKERTAELEESKRLAHTAYEQLDLVFQMAAEGMRVVESDFTIRHANQTFCTMVGLPREEVVGSLCHEVFSGPACHTDQCPVERLQRGDADRVDYEAVKVRPDGTGIPCMIMARPHETDSSGVAILETFVDITTQMETADSFRRAALHDHLTGLPNRALLLDRLEQLVASARRHDRAFAVAFLDLNGFKTVNDVHGHAVGDTVLREASRRMQDALREIDTLGRMGGDEFVAILPGVDDHNEAVEIITRIFSSLEAPIPVGGISVRVSTAVGLCSHRCTPEDVAEPSTDNAERAQELIRAADTAMFDAKAAREGNSLEFSCDINRERRG